MEIAPPRYRIDSEYIPLKLAKLMLMLKYHQHKVLIYINTYSLYPESCLHAEYWHQGKRKNGREGDR